MTRKEMTVIAICFTVYLIFYMLGMFSAFVFYDVTVNSLIIIHLLLGAFTALWFVGKFEIQSSFEILPVFFAGPVAFFTTYTSLFIMMWEYLPEAIEEVRQAEELERSENFDDWLRKL